MSPIQKASKKRFGVAIAFVVLLVLFTLALSIVLKPRGRDLPLEISMQEAGQSPLSVAVVATVLG
jgi:hypothetical protein